MIRGAKVEVKCACGCGEKFMARIADRKRGWGKFKDKSHKAREQERRTGQYGRVLAATDAVDEDDDDECFQICEDWE